jgi:hypothetical protein
MPGEVSQIRDVGRDVLLTRFPKKAVLLGTGRKRLCFLSQLLCFPEGALQATRLLASAASANPNRLVRLEHDHRAAPRMFLRSHFDPAPMGQMVAQLPSAC